MKNKNIFRIKIEELALMKFAVHFMKELVRCMGILTITVCKKGGDTNLAYRCCFDKILE